MSDAHFARPFADVEREYVPLAGPLGTNQRVSAMTSAESALIPRPRFVVNSRSPLVRVDRGLGRSRGSSWGAGHFGGQLCLDRDCEASDPSHRVE